jgi:hypothetical protein
MPKVLMPRKASIGDAHDGERSTRCRTGRRQMAYDDQLVLSLALMPPTPAFVAEIT